MKKIYLSLLIILVLVMIVLAIPQPEDSTVYYQNNNTCVASKSGMDIVVENCYARDFDAIDITQYVSFIWNGGVDKEVDWLFAYNGNLSDGAMYLWKNDEWLDISSKIEHWGYNKLGKSWQYYRVMNQSMQSGKTYKTKWVFTPKDKSKTGKWRIFGKLASEGIQEAIENNRYIFVDPWWDTICGDFRCNTTTWYPSNGNWSFNNVTGFAIFGSTTYPKSGYITQDVSIPQTKREYNVTLTVHRTWFNWTEFWVMLGNSSSEKFTSQGTHKFYLTTNENGGSNLTIWTNRTYNESINAYVIFNNITIVNSNRYLEIDFDTGTEDSGTTVYNNWIYVNNTICGPDFFSDMTYYLYNASRDLINSTTYTSPVYEINWTSLPDGLYFYNVTVVSVGGGNKSSTETRNITIDASTNTSMCKYVFKDNTVYTQVNNIITDNPACIYISGYNVTFDGNGYEIIGGGIYVDYAYNFTIKNTNSKIMQMETASYGNIIDNYIHNCTNECIRLGDNYADFLHNTFERNILNGSNDTGIHFRGISLFGMTNGASHNTFKDITFLDINGYDIYMPTISELFVSQLNKNNTFINCSFNDSYVSGVNNQLRRKWYYKADSDVQGINITINNSNFEYSWITDENGNVPKQELTEYYNNAGIWITYYDDYKVYTNGYPYRTYNLTVEENILDIYEFNGTGCSPPSSGIWDINASKNCIFVYDISPPTNISITENGTVIMASNLYMNSPYEIYKEDGSKLIISTGGKIWLKY